MTDENILQLPDEFENDFLNLNDSASEHQQVLLAAMKMDVRHFISNVLAVKFYGNASSKVIKRFQITLPQ